MNWKRTLTILGIIAGDITAFEVLDHRKRHQYYLHALDYCQKVQKPLLNVGCGNIPEYLGDVNVDIQEETIMPNYRKADITNLPFKDKEFGAAIAFHVIEHVDDPKAALEELRRVADRVYILVPHYLNLMAWISPRHKYVFVSTDYYRINPVLNLLVLGGIIVASILI